MQTLRYVASLPSALGAWLAYGGGVALFWANELLVEITRTIRGRA